jgi:hypothetical protein
MRGHDDVPVASPLARGAADATLGNRAGCLGAETMNAGRGGLLRRVTILGEKPV